MSHQNLKFTEHINPLSIQEESWLVSFGDLLTLLLCFFLSISSFSAQETAPQNIVSSLSPSRASDISGLKSVEEFYFSPGTALALTSYESVDLEFEIRSQQLKAGGLTVQNTPLHELIAQVNSGAYEIELAVLSICRAAGASANTSEWHTALESALQVRSQLIDGLAWFTHLRVRLSGEDCGTLNQSKAQDEFIGTLKLRAIPIGEVL